MWLIHLLFVRSSWIPTKLLRAREFGVPRTTEAPWAIWYASITRYHSSPFVLLGSPPRISSQRPRLGKRALHRPSFFSRKGLKILDPTVQYCYLEKQSQKRALVYIGLARNTLLGRCARAFSLHSTPLHSGRGGAGSLRPPYLVQVLYSPLILPSSLYTGISGLLGFFLSSQIISAIRNRFHPPFATVLWGTSIAGAFFYFYFLPRKSVARLPIFERILEQPIHTTPPPLPPLPPLGVIALIGRQGGRSLSIHVYRKGYI